MACCLNVSMDTLKGLIYLLERDLSVSAKDKLNLFLYQYPSKFSENHIAKLTRYLTILKKIEYAILRDVEDCYECEFYEKIYSAVNSMVSRVSYHCEANVSVDTSNKTAWELSHPYCITRSRWEELAYVICNDLSIKFEIIDKSCDLTFDLATNTISCDTIAALSVYDKMCELNYKVSRTEKECLLDYNLLIENHPDCDIDYRLYKELIACNLSYDIINQILCDNTNLGIVNGKPSIRTLVGDYIIGSDFSFKQVIAPSQCGDSLCRTEGSCTTDYPSFLKRLMSDYNLTKAQKEAILSKIPR